MNNETYSEVLVDRLIKIGEAFQAFVNAVHNIWRESVEFIEQIHEAYLILDEKSIWNTPKKLLMKSQVLNRKPLLARARSTC